MFGPKKDNFLDVAKASDIPDLVVEGAMIPVPDEADKVWQNKTDQLLQKNKKKAITKRLFKAVAEGDIWRVWYLLNIRQKNPEPENVISKWDRAGGDYSPRIFEKGVGRQDSRSIALLIASSFEPLSSVSGWLSFSKERFSRLPAKIIMGWYEKGLRPLPIESMRAVVRDCDIEQVAKFVKTYQISVHKNEYWPVTKQAIRHRDGEFLKVLIGMGFPTQSGEESLAGYARTQGKTEIAALLESPSQKINTAAPSPSSQTEPAKTSADGIMTVLGYWQRKNRSTIEHFRMDRLGDAMTRTVFDFAARRVTQIEENSDQSPLVLFSENFDDIQNGDYIAEAAKALESRNGNTYGYTVKNATPRIAAVKKPSASNS